MPLTTALMRQAYSKMYSTPKYMTCTIKLFRRNDSESHEQSSILDKRFLISTAAGQDQRESSPVNLQIPRDRKRGGPEGFDEV